MTYIPGQQNLCMLPRCSSQQNSSTAARLITSNEATMLKGWKSLCSNCKLSHLVNCMHISMQNYAVHKPLQELYHRPYKVVKCADEMFTIEVHASIDFNVTLSNLFGLGRSTVAVILLLKPTMWLSPACLRNTYTCSKMTFEGDCSRVWVLLAITRGSWKNWCHAFLDYLNLRVHIELW